MASDRETALLVRHLDTAERGEVHDRRKFHRDRRPEAYDPLTAP